MRCMRCRVIRRVLICSVLLGATQGGQVFAADLTVTKTDLPDPVAAGTDLTYTITATNSGTADAADVEISDLLPPGTTFVSATPSAGASCVTPPVGGTGMVSCTWAGATGVGVSRVLTLVVHVDSAVPAGSTITNVATAVSSVLAVDASADTLVIHQSNLVVTKDDIPDPVIAGENITYSITATNGGPSVASNVTISDPLPPSTTFVSAAPSAGGGCVTPPVGGTGTVSCTWAGITGIGVVRSLTLVVNVPLTVADGSTITNTAIAIPSVLANDATADTLVINQSNLTVTKDDLPDPVTAGEDITYEITATNGGPAAALDVEITDPLPPSTTFVSAAPSAGGACVTPSVGGTGTVTCTWAGVTGVGVVRSLTLVVNVPLTVADGSTITNTATAIPSVLANDATADTLVINQADLVVDKDDGVTTAVPGTSTTYTITVSNDGGTGSLFGTSSVQGSDPGSLFRIDLSTGLASLIGTPPGGTPNGMSDVSIDPVTGTMYAIHGAAVRGAELLTLDPATGADLSRAPVTSPFDSLAGSDALVHDASGTLFAGVWSEGRLLTLNPTTGVALTDVAVTGGDTNNHLSDLAYDPTTGELWASRGNSFVGRLVRLDPVTAAVLEIVDVPGSPKISAVAFDATGVLWASFEGTQLATVDLTTGTPTLIGSGFGGQKISGLGIGLGSGADVVGATVTDTFPPELSCTWTCAAGAGASCTAGPVTGDINDSVDIPSGSAVVYTVVCAIDASATGTLSNTATATVPAGVTDPVPSNNLSTDADTLTVMADLSVVKDDLQDPAAAGDPLSYVVTVDNAGPSDAAVVVATDTLPAGVSFVATSGCANDPAGVPACDLGTIGAGGSASYVIDVIVDAATPSGPITNAVSVASAGMDPDPSDDSDTEDTLVDADPPVVTLVGSVGNTGDGVLEECEEAKVAITRLLVSFNEPVQDPPGDSGPSDVTNPANYRLVAAGPNGDFATEICGPALDDDVAVPVDAVTYSAGALTASLFVNGGVALDDSLHRLLACGSTSIRDIAGNALDGDGDGTRGGDFLRTYRVDRGDLFSGGHFDCSIDPWVTVSTLPEEIEHSLDDVDESFVSGSAEVVNLSASTDFALGQCLAVAGGASHSLTGRVRLAMPAGGRTFLSRGCDFYAGPDCTGGLLLTETELAISSGTGGDWQPLASIMVAPAGTASALCGFGLTTPAGDDLDAHLDNLELRQLDPGDAGIFADGFESGDTSSWTSSLPPSTPKVP